MSWGHVVAVVVTAVAVLFVVLCFTPVFVIIVSN